MPGVRLAESDRAGSRIECDAPSAAALASSGLVQVHPVGSGVWSLLPNGRAGAVRVGGIDVVVMPKVGIARLLFLLGYAANPGFRPEDVEGISDEDLWPAVAETMCRHAERALDRGMLQGYVTEEAALRVVRGRIRIADQIARHPGMLLPIEVRYDEYSVDVAENRILRSAIRRMLTAPRVPPAIRARLGHLDGTLGGVTPLVAGTALPPWHPNRCNARYHSALRMAELVLHYQSFEVGVNGLNVAAFVVNMAAVFENFVTTGLREAWASRAGQTRAQFPAAFDEGRGIQMKVDVVHVMNGVPRIVADAKYKLEDSAGRYPNADHYQMLAYCTALKVPIAWLVYAQGAGDPLTRRVVNTPVEIVEYPLDLAAPPSDLLTQIESLADTAWQSADNVSPEYR
jgi:5-methylcytosine-specific restriction enzyme subunit McrC